MDRLRITQEQALIGAAHVLFWVGYVYYQGVIYSWQDTDSLRFTMEFHTGGIGIVLTMLLTYLNLLVLLPRLYYRGHVGWYGLALGASLLLTALVLRLLTHLLILPWEQLHDPGRYAKEVKHFWIPSRIVRLAVQCFPVVAILMGFELLLRAYRQEKHRRLLEQEKNRMEINYLKMQLNPHFLFNTLNSLYALIHKGSDQAGALVLELAGFMRHMLGKAGAVRIRLVDEIQQLNSYLYIEKLRFADVLDVSVAISGPVQQQTIMPLTLLPFAENAFKHGAGPAGGWVTIDLKVEADYLYYRVENSQSRTQPVLASSGLGLLNLRRRLELSYPGRFSLLTHDHGDSFEATLKIYL